jgi:hypothetical protein
MADEQGHQIIASRNIITIGNNLCKYILQQQQQQQQHQQHQQPTSAHGKIKQITSMTPPQKEEGSTPTTNTTSHHPVDSRNDTSSSDIVHYRHTSTAATNDRETEEILIRLQEKQNQLLLKRKMKLHAIKESIHKYDVYEKSQVLMDQYNLRVQVQTLEEDIRFMKEKYETLCGTLFELHLQRLELMQIQEEENHDDEIQGSSDGDEDHHEHFNYTNIL